MWIRTRPVAVLLATLVLAALPGRLAAHGGGGEITAVRDGGPAAAAGLRAGDRLLRLAGQRIVTGDDLRRVLAAQSPGRTIPVEIERDGATLELAVKLGAAPDGGVALGLSVALAHAAPPNGPDGTPAGEAAGGPEPRPTELLREACPEHLEATYRPGRLAAELGLDRTEEIATLEACVQRDLARMRSPMPVGWCDNVFKIHCSGLDLLTELGEELADRCAIAAATTVPAAAADATRCLRDRVFDAYTRDGRVIRGEECAAVVRECSEEDRSRAAAPAGDAPAATPEADAADPAGAWTAWGGPGGDFRTAGADLAPSWPEAGPPVLWRRPLGDGYSGVVVEDGRVVTMAREREDETVVALDAHTGATLWTASTTPPAYEGLAGYGTGPRATPLLAGGRVFAAGATGTLVAVDVADGTILWRRELWEQLGGRRLGHGYASSPIAYGDAVLATVGATDAGIVAFDRASGAELWRSAGFSPSYSTPRVAEILGRDQLLVFTADALLALDPDDGAPLWSQPHANQWGHNIAPPLVDGARIFLSSPQAGARGLRLEADGDGFRVAQVWSERRVQLYHGSPVLQGALAVGSSGVTTPAFLTAVDVGSGEIAWRRRGFAKANCVAVGDRLVLLDEDGRLALATATRDELVVHAETTLLDGVAWTAPTVVGTRLYARDRDEIVAVELGRTAADPA